MQIRYSVSIWNYTHYASIPSLDEIIDELRALDYGIELWPSWEWEAPLKDRETRAHIREKLTGMRVSLHTGGVATREEHAAQIDMASELGASVLVLHPSDLQGTDRRRPDLDLSHWVANYAIDRGVKPALENGQYPFLREVFENVPQMSACLDVGHVYLTDQPMARFLELMGPHLVHVHLQDIISAPERSLPNPPQDHNIPGTGGIPEADWRLFIAKLRELDFDGTGVFEIRPRSVLQSALLGKLHMARIL